MKKDGGSTMSAISDRLAERLALVPVAKTAITTVGGAGMRLVVQLGDVSVGSVTRSGLLASVATERDLAIVGGIDGVLGQDFLATYNFTVDYKRRVLVWDDLATTGGVADAPGSVHVPLIPRDGRFIIRLPQSAQGEPLEMVPDTGASTFVLFANEGGEGLPRRWSDATVTISGLTGSRAARYTSLRELKVGTLTFRNIPVVVVHRDEGGHEGADGLFPLHGFSRVSFRLSEGYLALER